MSEKYEGKNIAQCIEVASAAWTEIEALCQSIDNVAENQFKELNLRYEKPKRSYLMDASGWVGTDVAQSYGMLSRPKRKPSSYLGFQISVQGRGMAIAEEPLVHIFHFGAPIDFEDECIVFPLDENCVHRVGRNGLVLWPDETSPKWMFSTYLTSINSDNDVKMIVAVLIDLWQSKAVEDVPLHDRLPGLVSYRMEGGVITIARSNA